MKQALKISNFSEGVYLSIGIISFLMVWYLILFEGILQNLELMVYDRMLNYQTAILSRSPVVLITYTDQDLIELQCSSISDEKLADVLILLVKYNPRGIGVDLYRDFPQVCQTDRNRKEGKSTLSELAKGHPEIIFAKTFGKEASEGIKPADYLSPNQSGCTDFPKDIDDHVRRALLMLGNKPICNTFGFLLALQYLNKDGIAALEDVDNPLALRLGESRLPPLQSHDGGV
jgi:adenylate cyclase